MFDLLPEECLFIIIQYLLDDKKHLEDAIAVGNQTFKSWKLVCKHKYPLTLQFQSFQLRKK